MLGRYKRLWGKRPRLKSRYDAVIIGGGLHGLATAYFLGRDGCGAWFTIRRDTTTNLEEAKPEVNQ